MIIKNPANESLVVSTTEISPKANIIIFNPLGNVVSAVRHIAHKTTIQTSELAKGFYIIKVADQNKTYNKTFIVSR